MEISQIEHINNAVTANANRGDGIIQPHSEARCGGKYVVTRASNDGEGA